MSHLEPRIDLVASRAAFHRQHAAGTHKTSEDLSRYHLVIEATQPEVLVECGTEGGGSARWFAAEGLDVVTIDVHLPTIDFANPANERITWLEGSSTAPAIVAAARDHVAGRRCMVSLDSDHHAAHVAAEIRAYGPLVAPGCYLVVEDGIVRWLPELGYEHGPLDATEELLADDPAWQRDVRVEQLFAVSMFPAGWWERAAPVGKAP